MQQLKNNIGTAAPRGVPIKNVVSTIVPPPPPAKMARTAK